MIKKIIIIILLSLASTLRFLYVRADSGRMYELDNIITNGDMAIDTNADGLANNWILNETDQPYISNNIQYFRHLSPNASGGINQNVSIPEYHKIYVSFDFDMVLNDGYLYSRLYFIGQNNLNPLGNILLTDGHYSYLITLGAGIVTRFEILIYDAGGFSIAGYGNIMIFDLTILFGYGNEPTLSDFETYYLPDLNYFEYYNSFDPSSYVQLNSTDYANIETDLTGIDYSKSIIARNGDNMTIDFYAYFYDSSNGSGSSLADYYKRLNNPEMKYLDKTTALSWEYSDYSDRVLKLSLTTDEKRTLKTILFNRVVDPENEYFSLLLDAYIWNYVKIYVVMTSTFDLLVDVKSFMISRETETENDFNVNNEMNIKTYDRYGDLYLPVIKLNMAGDELETRVIDGFGSGYTRISRFNFEFEFTSPASSDPYDYEIQKFYEFGIFSSDNVLIPPAVEIPAVLDGIFPYMVCDAFQLGCHIKNTINDGVLWMWDALNVEGIYQTFSGIVASVNDVIDLLPDDVNDILIVFASALGVGFIILIFDRSSKGGDS